jgi:hypothetical protein
MPGTALAPAVPSTATFPLSGRISVDVKRGGGHRRRPPPGQHGDGRRRGGRANGGPRSSRRGGAGGSSRARPPAYAVARTTVSPMVTSGV